MKAADKTTSPTRLDYTAVAHELFEIDALLAGAAAIIEGFRDDHDPDNEALNALKLLRRAIESIPPLAENIENAMRSEAANG